MKENIDFRENINKIKYFINKYGGLYICDRQVGKSEALLELLHENDNCYILVCTVFIKKHMKERYKKMFNDKKENNIICSDEALDEQIENSYIDEYFFHNKLYNKFKGAVSTMRFPIIVDRFVNRENKNNLSEISYRKEYLLDFS